MPTEMVVRILRFVEDTFPSRGTIPRPLQPDSPLFSSRIIDSMGLVELLVFLEQAFGVTLDDSLDELTTLDTAAQLARHVEQHQRTQRRA